ncbi:peptidylprolyl isomerase [Sinisalibacter aestuarii]|uniref:Peptidyl-prolyl cis-trans isomerase n=1 Tax=Sinisalibacter aestuarii TaxID=2949426 RepID=A0ABQ5LVT9_9RHOB|nr:peptidylprolyl isomerase [Sinisalibacter aestuarii]GKY89082.1 peptidyl-prolyl cis-trans isomerase [Sinisalibacter aestuarii]
MSMARNKISQFFVWIIMALVLVGLVGFGSFNFGGGVSAIGKVGDTDISADRYFREVNAQLNAVQAQTGQHLPFAQAQAFGLDRAALETVIDQVALENETARLGVSVGDEELAARIRDISAFTGVNGSFDRQTYQFVLEQSGMTPGDFEESLRSEVARMILQTAVTNGIAMPAAYTDTLYAWVREERDFTWARLDASTLDEPVGLPDEAELTAWYEAHPDDFTLPQTRKLTYVWLKPEDVLDRIEVTDEELRKLYDDRIDEFQSPERRLVERLVFGTADEAAAAAQRLADGSASFEDLVAERGLNLTDIDLGDMTRADLGAAGDAVFALDAPGVAGPVDTELGPALFRMNAILNAHEVSFDEAVAGLKADYAADAARRYLSDMVTDLDDALAGGATLEDLAADHGMTLATLDWTGAQNDGIAAYDAFREAATLVEDGDYPQIEDLSDGGLFALRLDEVIAPRLQTLDEVREAAVAGWQAQETVARVMARADEMIGAFATGESPASLGLTEVAETDHSRDAYIEGTPPAMIERVFALDAPGDWAVVEDATGAVLLRLDAVHEADQTTPEALDLKTGFAQSTAQALALDVQSAFSAALEAQAGIVLDQAMINAVNASFQ